MSDQNNGTVVEQSTATQEQSFQAQPRPELTAAEKKLEKAARKAAAKAAKEAERLAAEEDADDDVSPLDTAAYLFRDAPKVAGETSRQLTAADGTKIRFAGSLDTDDPQELAALLRANEKVSCRAPAKYRAAVELTDRASKVISGEQGAAYILARAAAIQEREDAAGEQSAS